MNLKPKKSLGQHFLINEELSERIVSIFIEEKPKSLVLEIGPGKGVLTGLLIKQIPDLYCCELDDRMGNLVSKKYKIDEANLLRVDVLKLDFKKQFGELPVSVIGNFPYNISSQILFHVLENKEQVPWLVGMFQKEMAKRVASEHGSKEYGVISVLMQAYYDIEFLFELNENDFDPPPKVKSGVISLKRKKTDSGILSQKHFTRMVKVAFLHRRKMLRNTWKEFYTTEELNKPQFTKRPEQYSVQQFIDASNEVYLKQKNADQ